VTAKLGRARLHGDCSSVVISEAVRSAYISLQQLNYGGEHGNQGCNFVLAQLMVRDGFSTLRSTATRL
jgi:hypothetical protein